MSRLDPRLLLQGYAAGIFPMADSRDADELFWVEPRNRAILPLERFHLSRTLRRTLRSDRFSVTKSRMWCPSQAPQVMKRENRAIYVSAIA